jgi:hypothetical protein
VIERPRIDAAGRRLSVVCVSEKLVEQRVEMYCLAVGDNPVGDVIHAMLYGRPEGREVRIEFQDRGAGRLNLGLAAMEE